MTAALASLQRYKNTFIIDVALLAALYLLPSFSHATALPLYMFEPMRVALIVALLFTNRANAYFIAFTLPLASSMITGHPVPFKALLMGIELAILVAGYAYLIEKTRIPAFAALTAAILLSKVIYYTMKYAALSIGLLGGSLVSTPLQTQLLLAIATAAVFGLVEYFRTGNKQPGR
jgi:hypothetical protein